MTQPTAGCSRQAVRVEADEVQPTEPMTTPKEEPRMIRVGKPAPDFTAPAFYNGEFTEVSLKEFTDQGKWVYICFYPGDFTFV